MSLDLALLDANVLYSAAMRDIFMQLALTKLFDARWTEAIHREWIESILRDRPELNRDYLEHTRYLMNKKVENAVISGYEALIPDLNLPDPDDRHVLAAAIIGNCNIIVTLNLDDFPAQSLAPHSITVQHPDEFLSRCFDLSPARFCAAIQVVRSRLKKPPFTVTQYLENLKQRGLVATATKLEQFAELI
jgi:predicted nucleic acid-binding protein